MASNGSSDDGARNSRTGGLVAVVGAIVLGILGMHGLSQHGATLGHADRELQATGATVHAHADLAAMDAGEVPAGVTRHLVAATATGAAAAGDGGSAAGDVALLCAFMLLSAAAGLLLILRVSRLAHAVPLSPRPHGRTVRRFVSERLDTGPPAVWRFSVVRC